MAALVRIAPYLRAVLAAHVALQLMDRRRLRTPNYVQRHRLMRVAAKAFDFDIDIACVKRIAQCGGRLSRSLKAEHALVPGMTGEPISPLTRLRSALR